MNRPIPNLCIFHPGALGDGLLALNALRELKHLYPRHRLIWFGHQELGDVYVKAGEVHESYSFDRVPIWPKINRLAMQPDILTAVFRQCERAVGWMNDSDEKWQRWFNNLGITEFILQSPRDPLLQSYHLIDRFVETLLPWLPGRPVIDYQKNEKDSHDALLLLMKDSVPRSKKSFEGMIILHPGSGSIHKCASGELWANIVKACKSKFHGKICLLGGPADAEALKQLKDIMGEELYILEGLNLLSVVDYLQRANLFIGHDSGISHLASRLGVPSVLLFGPTDPQKWAPRGTHVAIIENSCQCREMRAWDQCLEKPCLSFSVEKIMAKVMELLIHKKFDVSLDSYERRDESSSLSCLG